MGQLRVRQSGGSGKVLVCFEWTERDLARNVRTVNKTKNRK
jgi:hypothetical protein